MGRWLARWRWQDHLYLPSLPSSIHGKGIAQLHFTTPYRSPTSLALHRIYLHPITFETACYLLIDRHSHTHLSFITFSELSFASTPSFRLYSWRLQHPPLKIPADQTHYAIERLRPQNPPEVSGAAQQRAFQTSLLC